MKKALLVAVIALVSSAAMGQGTVPAPQPAQEQIERVIGNLVVVNAQLTEQVGQLRRALEAKDTEIKKLQAPPAKPK